MKAAQVRELLLQGLQTEQGGMLVYETALTCVQNDELKEEWTKYLQQTRRHVEIMQDLCVAFRVDPEQMTPGREVVRHHGQSWSRPWRWPARLAREAAAELVATECVVLAETKDHLNWELLAQVKEKASGTERQGPQGGHRGGRGGRGRAPLPLHGLVPGAVDPVPGPAAPSSPRPRRRRT